MTDVREDDQGRAAPRAARRARGPALGPDHPRRVRRPRSEIDALNVFPVPDGDTGTNLYLTFDAALDAVRAEHERAAGRPSTSGPRRASADGLARATLLGARGNSGVILSQLVRGLQRGRRPGGGPCRRRRRPHAGRRAAPGRATWPRASVTRPVEGTILSVATAAAARRRGGRGRTAPRLYDGRRAPRCAAARTALAATPDQLPALGPRRRRRRRRRRLRPGPRVPRPRRSTGDGRARVVRRRDDLGCARRARSGPRRRPRAGRGRTSSDAAAGVRGDVPARDRRRRASRRCASALDGARRLPGRRRRPATCGTSTSTSTTSAPPSRPASRPGGRTGSGSPTSPSSADRAGPAPVTPVAGRGAAPPGAGLADVFRGRRRRGGPQRARPAAVDRADPRGDPRGARRSSVIVLPNDSDTLLAAEAAARAAARRGHRGARRAPAGPRCRAWPRWPSTTPRGRPGRNVLAMTAPRPPPGTARSPSPAGRR